MLESTESLTANKWNRVIGLKLDFFTLYVCKVIYMSHTNGHRTAIQITICYHILYCWPCISLKEKRSKQGQTYHLRPHPHPPNRLQLFLAFVVGQVAHLVWFIWPVFLCIWEFWPSCFPTNCITLSPFCSRFPSRQKVAKISWAVLESLN